MINSSAWERLTCQITRFYVLLSTTTNYQYQCITQHYQIVAMLASRMVTGCGRLVTTVVCCSNYPRKLLLRLQRSCKHFSCSQNSLWWDLLAPEVLQVCTKELSKEELGMVFPTTHSPLLYLTALRRFIGSPEAVPGCLFLVFGGKAKGGAYLQGRNTPGREKRPTLSTA